MGKVIKMWRWTHFGDALIEGEADAGLDPGAGDAVHLLSPCGLQGSRHSGLLLDPLLPRQHLRRGNPHTPVGKMSEILSILRPKNVREK